jgi:hypothetical protein
MNSDIVLDFQQLSDLEFLDLKSEIPYNLVKDFDLLKLIYPKHIININGFNKNIFKYIDKYFTKDIYSIVYKFEDNIWNFSFKDGLLHSLTKPSLIHYYNNKIIQNDIAYYLNGKEYSYDSWVHHPNVKKYNREKKLKEI